jgi:hypothetical protein
MAGIINQPAYGTVEPPTPPASSTVPKRWSRTAEGRSIVVTTPGRIRGTA